MYEAKTKATDQSVMEFIEQIDHTQRREDAYRLLEIFSDATGFNAVMWGDSMIGFGAYRYRYASGHEGETFLAGFSPRKAKISLYLNLWDSQSERLLEGLGKHTRGKSCVYISKLADVDLEVLKELIVLSVKLAKEKYPDHGV
ncbi:MAG TPA: DUF1801 domain-containing protein [Firmicutes bacterium]|jgi:hypothetical protein|nr:DUF1801 domain-containing protein [Bacillota bacterium]